MDTDLLQLFDEGSNLFGDEMRSKKIYGCQENWLKEFTKRIVMERDIKEHIKMIEIREIFSEI